LLPLLLLRLLPLPLVVIQGQQLIALCEESALHSAAAAAAAGSGQRSLGWCQLTSWLCLGVM
jgi:hypothetical protein